MRDDYSEFASMKRIRQWQEHAGDLQEEALGHAVGLRDCLYEGDMFEAQDRSLHLVDVLNALQGVADMPVSREG